LINKFVQQQSFETAPIVLLRINKDFMSQLTEPWPIRYSMDIPTFEVPMQPNLLQITVSQTPTGVVVKLAGEARLNVEAAGMQLDRVAVHRPKLVVVDCSELSFISSLGMSLLVQLRRSVARNGGIVRLAAVQPLVRGALQHACLFDIMPEFPDVATALAEAPPAPSPAQ
jgi:anti-anti-sigma factor